MKLVEFDNILLEYVLEWIKKLQLPLSTKIRGGTDF